jgi:hypothetical protein
MIKKIEIVCIFMIWLSSICFSDEVRTYKNINLSYGDSSFVILNVSRDKWINNRLKMGLETNIITRKIVSIEQDVVDTKIYTGWLIINEDDISIDLRIGYGVSITYYPSVAINTTDIGYAPV